ncbi:MAG: cytochrome b N-terminal domain-containing protein [Planctomycetaceae bacterium]|jgi:ubiquinol-cytochrome c reductase cytochrome b subunit|nr:cytochrome b N-terminal domain-containing protein [Planctomycetaceae bacterium]
MQNLFLQWLDERTGIPTLCDKIRHWSVPTGYCRFLPTMIIFAFVLQAITGVFLWAYYSPSAQSAWESLFFLQFVLPGGWMIRGIHHFSAQLLTVLLGLYLLGLVFSGKYRSPKEFVFWSAFILFLFSLASSLTGDLLSWTLSGFSATLVRVRFLQMIPLIGEPLFRIVCGGTEFGTLTIPRFLVLHILVFGGGFFVMTILWRFFDHRSTAIADGQCDSQGNTQSNIQGNVQSNDKTSQSKYNCNRRRVPFWSSEVLKCSLAWIFVMAVILLLVYRQPILHAIRPDLFSVHENLPREASLGVHLGAPADPAGFYDAARPEWSFRALYHFCNLKVNGENGEIDVFPGERKYIPIFVVTGCLMIYALLIPVIGRLKIGHYFNVAMVLFLFLSVGYLTYASYRHDYADPAMESFRQDEAKAERIAERAVELCLAPDGIPPTGSLTLLQRDPLLQGPVLYAQHCAICHPFKPLDGEQEHPDFQPISCETPKGPNLYQPIRKKWIEGFFDTKRIRSDDYFGKTKFASGTMVGYVRGELKEISKDEDTDGELLDQLIDVLYADAQRDRLRVETPNGVEGLAEEQLELFATFNCGQCHKLYAQTKKPVIQAPDLRGYMSRDWMMGIIADPVSTRYYGPAIGKDKGNDEMPSFYLSPEESVLSREEIETLVDWLRGKWYRFRVPSPDAANEP